MTNRDYLMRLNNEELANAIGRCHMACEETKCESIDCQKCCLKWLERERIGRKEMADKKRSV